MGSIREAELLENFPDEVPEESDQQRAAYSTYPE